MPINLCNNSNLNAYADTKSVLCFQAEFLKVYMYSDTNLRVVSKLSPIKELNFVLY